MSQHSVFIAYSKTFPLLHVEDEGKGTRGYVVTSGSQLQASFSHCPLRLHLHSTFQANTSSPCSHQVENMLQRYNAASTSNSAAGYLLSFCFETDCWSASSKHRQSELFCLENNTQTQRTRVHSESKAFLKNNIHMCT